MKTVQSESKFKLIVKKSSFTSLIFPISSIADVKNKLKIIRSKYKSARHIPYAYSLAVEHDDSLVFENRFDDDGEPNKTAGLPLLKLIEQNNLTNVLIVVVRVFGGVKLGTAGLYKAFFDSANNALKENTLVDFKPVKPFIFEIPLKFYSDFESFLKKESFIYSSSFEESLVHVRVNLNFTALKEEKEKITLFLSSLLKSPLPRD